MPLGNLSKGVDSDQQKQPVAVLERLLQAPHGIDRVVGLCRSFLAGGRRFFRSLQQRRNESLFLRRRQRQHGKTVNKWRQWLPLLMRRSVRRHKVDAAQLPALKGGVCQSEVSAMNRIERSAK